MSDFPYPLPQYALAEFCGTRAGFLLSAPVRQEREILAGNGYLAIRCHRGGWIDHEFAAASASYLARFEALPWGRWEQLGDDWRALDLGSLCRRGRIDYWINHRPAPSPVWRVGSAVVRLSMLQQVARLPRCEVNWTPDQDTPLFFRFSGGRGMIARDARLTLWSYALFQPRVDCLSGELRRTAPARMARMAGNLAKPSPEEPRIEDWPPAYLEDSMDEHVHGPDFL